MRRYLLLLASLVLGLSVLGCDLLGDDTDDGGVDPGADSGPPPSGVLTTKSAGESVEADFSAAGSYLVVPYSVSTVAADSIDFTITVTGGGSTTSITRTLRQPRASLQQRKPALYARWQARMAVERWTRSQAERAALMKMLAPNPSGMTHHAAGASCKLSSECKATEVCAGGACSASVTIKVKEFAKVDTIKAQVKARGKVAAVLVDSADTVSASAVSSLLKAFEETIYKRDVALFGNPKLQSSGAALASDRNGDGLVWLVLTKRTSDKLKAVGFFNAMDFTGGANSNKADILYVDSSSTSKLKSVYPILAHEFQHLLNFAVKKYKPEVNGGSGALEALWLDEGQAHFAEDACGYGGENVTVLDEQSFPDFGDASVFYTSKTNDTLAYRAMAYLFVQYLFEQQGGVSYSSDGGISDKGGAAFLKRLHTTSKQGTGALDQALGKSYKAAFDSWIAALALDGRGISSYGAYNYKALTTDPVTGNSIGLKVRGSRKDNDGKMVKLTGPTEESLAADTDESVSNGSAKFYELKGTSGKKTIKVTSKASDFRFALIKLK